jgi:beta-galactosidase
LAGLGSGKLRDVSSFQQGEKKVFQGRGLVVIRDYGKVGYIRIVAIGEGLRDGVLMVKSE